MIDWLQETILLRLPRETNTHIKSLKIECACGLICRKYENYSVYLNVLSACSPPIPYTFMSLINYIPSVKWAASSEFGTYRLCEQRRFRQACASAQSRQNIRCSLIQAMSQEEPSDRKPDPWPLWMTGHAQLKFDMTECLKTQIRLTRPINDKYTTMRYLLWLTIKGPLNLSSKFFFCLHFLFLSLCFCHARYDF